MPRRPWRSLNAFSASPIRVPLDQSGAAAAARWIARSGWREASARVRRVSRVAKTNASAFGAAAGGAGQELQVGARVGLHRARDVAQQHEPPRDDAAAPAREADRVAAGAQARRAASAAGRSARPWRPCSWRRVRRSGVASLEARHQPVELRELVRVERVEALAGQPLLVAGHRQRDLDLGARRRPRRPPRRRRRAPARPRPDRSGAALVLGRRRGRRGGAARSARASRSSSSARRGAAEDRRGRPRRRPATWAWSETNTARAVQYRRRRVSGRTSASARAKSAERSGVTGTPASCRRRLSAPASGGRSSWIVSTPKCGHRFAHELVEAGRADHLLVLVVLEHRPERAVHGGGVERLDAEQAQRRQPVDRLGDARRLLHVGVAHRATRRRRPGPRASRRRPGTRRRTISTSRSGRRVVDPVVQAAALDRVVQVARAVGGQDDDRRVRARGSCRAPGSSRCASASSSSRNASKSSSARSISSISSTAGRGPGMLERAQQRAADQVVRPEQLLLAQRRRRPPRRAGCSAAGAGSSTRTAPRPRRCPRSTAGGSAACRARRASALAASVLPTPASPSSSSGCGSRRLRNIDVARPSSTR